MEDNLSGADPLSYATNVSQGDLGNLVSVSNVHNPTPKLPVGPWIKNIGQVSNLSFNYPPKDNRSRGMAITFLHGCSNEADHSRPQ